MQFALRELGGGHFGLLQYRSLLLDLNIPVNLVKLMSLSLRAGYPMVQPPEAARAWCKVASRMWALSSALFRDLLVICHTCPDEPDFVLSKAVVDQLQPFTSDGAPGEALASCIHLLLLPKGFAAYCGYPMLLP
jgi:hypothetical protein